MDEEIKEIKKSLDFMSGEISTISKHQKLILEMMGEIKELKKQCAEEDKMVALLECCVADLQQYSRMNDIVVSGLQTKPRTYGWLQQRPAVDPPSLTRTPSSNSK